MGASHNLANTGVLPEVSCTIRPAGFSCAHDVIAKSSCAANGFCRIKQFLSKNGVDFIEQFLLGID